MHFFSQVDSFVNHCDANYLKLNVSKTDERYVKRILLNNKLSWRDHVDCIIKKLDSRMYCPRKIKPFPIRPEIITTIVGVWRHCLVCWEGNVSKSENRCIGSIARKADRVTDERKLLVYLDLLRRKLEMVCSSDKSYPLHDSYEVS